MKKEGCWYKKGLQFSCAKCGKCCGGFPGYVFLSKEDIEKITLYLKISKEDFLKTYTRTSSDGLISLKEKAVNYDCIFLKDHSCIIYPVRPMQCQTYPWWEYLLASKEHWEEEQQRCKGINAPSGELHSFEEIQKELTRFRNGK